MPQIFATAISRSTWLHALFPVGWSAMISTSLAIVTVVTWKGNTSDGIKKFKPVGMSLLSRLYIRIKKKTWDTATTVCYHIKSFGCANERESKQKSERDNERKEIEKMAETASTTAQQTHFTFISPINKNKLRFTIAKHILFVC